MKPQAIKCGVVIGLVVSVVLSMPLWAAQSTKQKKLDTEKIDKPQETKSPIPTPDTTLRLPGPKINEFSCESLTGGYNINLFGGPACVNCRLSVNFDIYARQGLRKFEITFRGHQVHEENFGGPAVSSRSCRDLRLDLASHRPARSGTYTLQARVVDRSGQTTTKSIRLRCDMERPRITNVVPRDGETIYADGARAAITFEITASDDFSGIQEVRVTSLYFIGSGGGIVPDNYFRGSDTTAPYHITINGIEPLREWRWHISATDRAGNIGEYGFIDLHLTPRPVRLPGPVRP